MPDRLMQTGRFYFGFRVKSAFDWPVCGKLPQIAAK
jgi:hypothetical protein